MARKKHHIIAQELKFAKSLKHNDKKVRDKMLKQLRSWLSVRSHSSFAFTEMDFLRIWKGLFYCMWMSDKPLIQEELAESLSKLVHCLHKLETALLYTKCAFTTLSNEWFGLDQYRIDKFEMLTRRIFRQTLVMCKKKNWDEKYVKGVAKIIEDLIGESKTPGGFKLHVIDIYMEEIAKISGGQIPEEMLLELIRPFAIHLAASPDVVQLRHILKNIFRYLIFQSDVGLDYQEKFNAWKNAGFPTGSIDAMEKVELDDENDDETHEEEAEEEIVQEGDTENKPLDPRAGRVNVDIPQLPFNPMKIADLLKEYKFLPSSNPETRRKVEKLIKDFTALAEGEMPIGIKKVEIPEDISQDLDPDLAAFRLEQFEEELYADTKTRQKRKKLIGSILENDSNDVDGDDDEPVVKKPKKLKKKASKEEPKPAKPDKLKKVNKLSKVNKINKVDKVKKVKKMKKVLKKTAGEVSIKNQLKTDLFKVTTNPDTLKLNQPPKEQTSKKKDNKSEEETPKKKRITPIPVENSSWIVATAKKAEKEFKKSPSPKKTFLDTSTLTYSAKKRVKIVLKNNTAQNTSEYFHQLRSSPSIPFDANRKPSFGVLKPSPIKTPINPFYRKKT